MRIIPLLLAFVLGWFCSEGLRFLKLPDKDLPKIRALGYEFSMQQVPSETMPMEAPSAKDAADVTAMASLGVKPLSTPSGSGLRLNGRQSQTHGLLISSFDRGEAGSASKMSAIALESAGLNLATLTFNQHVGEMMDSALTQVRNYMQVRHRDWPRGFAIELSFEDRYSPKDGSSAAVACALLLESLITGKDNDPAFAVTGDMNSDGSVQPIGGVAAKIRGATNGRCKLVAIPKKNESALADILVTDGPGPFAKIQIYGIETFDEAAALALKEKPAVVQSAITDLAAVQEVLLRDPKQMGLWLRNQHVLAKLQAVQQAMPNSLSAKYLLMQGTGRVPQTLSLAGSLEALDNAAGDLISSIKTNKGQNANMLRKDVVGSSITRLQNLRARCDLRVRAYAEGIIRFGQAVKEAQDRPPNSASRASVLIGAINSAADIANSEFKRLMDDPALREELQQ